ncbi:MAG: DUF2752 domain-containing protein [Anaerorhabdus sp.]
MKKSKTKEVILLALLVFATLVLFGASCPIEKIIGIPCPGCGMFTAFYYLFQGKLTLALYFHPLVLVCLAYFVVLGASLVIYHKLDNKIARISTFIFIGLLVIVYIYRMATIFPQPPMMFNENSLLGWLIRVIEGLR